MSSEARGRSGATQARGRARRQALLGAARELLEQEMLNAIVLPDVAARAGIPKGSAYYFYPDIHALLADLAALHDEELNALLVQPLPPAESWQAVIAALIERSADYFWANRSAQQLMFGPHTPPDIKRTSRTADFTHAAVFEAQVDRQFVLPQFPDRDRIFFRAVEAVDLMFGLSLLEYDALERHMVGEAHRMACAYLDGYIPATLPRRPDAAQGDHP